ncbi:MAG TPA: hypothetical protein V6C76_17850 [Drouetiella sp.]
MLFRRTEALITGLIAFAFSTSSVFAQQYPSSPSASSPPDRFHTLESSPHRGQLLNAPISTPQPAASKQPVMKAAAPKTAQNNHKKGAPNGKNLPPQASPGQMASMLDEVAGGKSPTLPPHPPGAHYATQSSHLPPSYAAHGSQRTSYARQTGMMPQHAGGMPSRSMMGGFGHGMMPGGMPGNIIRPSHMGGGMGAGAGMGAMAGHGIAGGAPGMGGGNAAKFFQQLQQMQSAQSGEGGEGESAGGGANPMAGGGMEAQLMQKLFHSGMPGAGAMPGPGGMGGGGGMPGGGAMPGMMRGGFPGGMGNSMPRQSFGMQSSGIKRPPGVSGIAGGASFPSQPHAQGAGSSSSASDLEKQMEAQYGK